MKDPNPTPPDPTDAAARLLRAAAQSSSEDAAALAAVRAAFPQLRVERRIGEGGMAVVYRCIQPKLQRTVALKILKSELAAQPEFQARFEREARALASLDHPRILRVLEYGERDGLLFLLTDFVDGTDLRRLLALGQLSPEEALRLVPQICEALRYAHLQGIVHRDVKPENILVDMDGNVRIADFGLARIARGDNPPEVLTRTTQVLGTPHYMAPEQWRSGKVDHRADIYALGVVFYEMLTGELPIGTFAAPSERASVPERVDDVVKKALAQDPERRYQQVEEFESELEHSGASPQHAATHRQASDPASPAATRARPTTAQVAQIVLPIAAAGVGLVGAIALAGWLAERADDNQSHRIREMFWIGVFMLSVATVVGGTMASVLRSTRYLALRELATATAWLSPWAIATALVSEALHRDPTLSHKPWVPILTGCAMLFAGIAVAAWRVTRVRRAHAWSNQGDGGIAS